MSTDLLIDDFRSTADGDDWVGAFERAQQIHGTANSAYAAFGGFTLRFLPKAYYFSRPLHVRRPIALLGSGTVANPGTILMFPKGSKGLVIHGYSTSNFTKYCDPATDDGSFAQGASAEKLMLLAVDPRDRRTPAASHAMIDFRESTLTPNPGAHGITAYTMVVLRDVTVARFDGHGIYVYGNGDDDSESAGTSAIAAFCQLTNVFVSENGGDGLHIFGNDASGAQVQSSQFVHNAGFGIHDLNSIGQTTVIGGQVSYNVLGGVARGYEVANRDYDTLAQQLRVDISDAPPATAATLSALAAAIPAALAAATPRPSVGDFPVLQGSLQENLSDPAYRIAYRSFYDAWVAHRKSVGDNLQSVLLAAGFDANRALTHLDYRNPYAVGGDVFLNVYGESNGIGAGDYNIVGLTTMSVNSDGISSKTDALGWSAQGFRNTLLGALGVAAASIEVDQVALRSSGSVQTISSSSAAPTGAAQPGTLMLNTNPVAGGYVGWVSMGDGNWREFGQIA